MALDPRNRRPLPETPDQKLGMARSVNYPERPEDREYGGGPNGPGRDSSLSTGDDAYEIHRLKGMLNASIAFEDEYRTDCEKALAFYDGDQLDDDDLEILAERQQPPIAQDEIGPTVDFLLGLQDVQPLEWDPHPRRKSDDQIADAARGVLKFIDDENEGSEQWLEARKWALTYGFGPIAVGFYVRDPNEESEPVQFEAFDPREFLFDPKGRKKDLSDYHYLIRRRVCGLRAVRAEYEEHADVLEYAAESPDNSMDAKAVYKSDSSPDVINEGGVIPPADLWDKIPWNRAEKHANRDLEDPDNRPVILYELWERYKGVGFLFEFEGGIKIRANENNMDMIQTLMQRGDLVSWKVSRNLPLVRYWVFTGDIILARGESPYAHGDLPFKVVWHKKNRYGYPVSLVAMMIDPQSEINARRQRLLFGLLAKSIRISPRVLERMNITKEEAEERAANPNALWIAEESEFEIFHTDTSSAAQMELLQDSRSHIHRTASRYAEMSGDASNGRTGAAREIAIAQAHLPLRPQERNLRLVHKEIGEMVWQLVQQAHANDQRWIVEVTDNTGAGRFITVNEPVVDEDGGVTILNNIQMTRFAFRVGNSVYHPTMRARTSEMLADLAMKVQDPRKRERIIAASIASGEIPKDPMIIDLLKELTAPDAPNKAPARPPTVSIPFRDLPPDTKQYALERADLPPSQFLNVPPPTQPGAAEQAMQLGAPDGNPYNDYASPVISGPSRMPEAPTGLAHLVPDIPSPPGPGVLQRREAGADIETRLAALAAYQAAQRGGTPGRSYLPG